MPGKQQTPKNPKTLKKLVSDNVAAEYNFLPGTGTPMKRDNFLKALNFLEEYTTSKIAE